MTKGINSYLAFRERITIQRGYIIIVHCQNGKKSLSNREKRKYFCLFCIMFLRSSLLKTWYSNHRRLDFKL